MLMEGFVGVMALIAATVLLPNDYLAMNVAPERWADLGIVPVELYDFGRMVNEDLAGRTAGSVTLAVGMAHIFSSLPAMSGLMAYWYHFAIMFEALFILTTVDAGTRVARYLVQEVLGRVRPRFGDINWWPSVVATSAIVCAAWGYLLYQNDVSTIWPMFGVANQLLATLGLVVGTGWLLRHGRRKVHALITGVPAAYMATTTLTAGLSNIIDNYLPKAEAGDPNGYLNAGLTAVMMACVLAVVADAVVRMWRRVRR
jgi:carbon starvation protein